MKIDTFVLPIDWQKVRIHREANRIGKRYVDVKKIQQNLPDYGKKCQQCNRIETHCPKFKFCQNEDSIRQRYGYYGPNCVIYLGFIKRIIIFMLFCIIVYFVPLLVLNLLGIVCKTYEKACTNRDIIYQWSTYNVLGENPGSLPNHIIWLVLSLTICFFNLYLRKYSLQTFRIINNRNVTDSDFSIILKRLPKETTQQDIKYLIEKQMSKYYDQLEDKKHRIVQQMERIKVRNIIMINKFDKIMEVNQKNVEKFKKQSDKRNKKIKKIQKRRKKLKSAQVLGRSVHHAQIIQPQLNITEQNQQFKPEELPPPDQFAQAAIVRFDDSRAKDLILKTVRISPWMNIICYFFPFYSPLCQVIIRNKHISILKAPEPEDIKWQNFGYSENFRILRKILASLSILSILLVSSAISIGVSIWIESLLVSTGIQPIYLTIILIFVTLSINILIQFVIGLLIQWMKLDTITDQTSEHLSVTVINQSFNLGFFSIFAPILAKLPSFIKLDTTESSSFPVVMFTTIIIQSFLGTTISFLLAYFQIIRKLFEYLDRQKIIINTQTEAYKKFKNLEVPFVYSYAHNVKIVWFSFLYGVVTPMCIPIGFVGLVFYYYYQKILFNSKYSIPVYGGSRINSTMIDLLDFSPFLIGIFNLFLYQTTISFRNLQSNPAIIAITITNTVIGGVFAIFPWRIFINRFYNQKQSNRIDYFDRDKLDTYYQKTYPAFDPVLIENTHAFIHSRRQLEQQLTKQKKKVDLQGFLQSLQSKQNINCCCT